MRRPVAGSPPRTHVTSASDDLDDDHVLGDMLPDHINVQVRQGLQQLRVERANPLQAHVVRVPRLIIIASRFPKGRQNAVETVLVFPSNVLRNDLAPRLRRAGRVQALSAARSGGERSGGAEGAGGLHAASSNASAPALTARS